MSNDPDLQRHFDALKHDEQRLAPPFARLFRIRAKRASRRFPRLAAATALLLILIAVPIAVRRWSGRNVGAHGLRPVAARPVPTWAGEMTLPTDFLLATPNAELLRSLPEIGTTSIPLVQGVSQ